MTQRECIFELEIILIGVAVKAPPLKSSQVLDAEEEI
tara:strand:- start:125 stop:235 length:111 start_codon:yes stop_codon:yes gene_type:complete